MKYMKRAGVYKASNVTFDPKTLSAFSYGWWRFVAVIEGRVIFNDYRYSNTTSRHQRKTRRLMDELGITIDQFMPLPGGIKGQTLAELYEEAELHLCDDFLREEEKRISRNEKAARRRAETKNITRAVVTHAAHESRPMQMGVLYLVRAE